MQGSVLGAGADSVSQNKHIALEAMKVIDP